MQSNKGDISNKIYVVVLSNKENTERMVNVFRDYNDAVLHIKKDAEKENEKSYFYNDQTGVQLDGESYASRGENEEIWDLDYKWYFEIYESELPQLVQSIEGNGIDADLNNNDNVIQNSLLRPNNIFDFISDRVGDKLDKLPDVDVAPDYHIDRDGSHWYRGNVISITTDTHAFHIAAIGDQYYTLFIKEWQSFNDKYMSIFSEDQMEEYHKCFLQGDPIVTYKNKDDHYGTFLENFRDFFTTDYEFEMLVNSDNRIFDMIIDNNNWYEIFVEAKDNTLGRKISINDVFEGYDVGSYLKQEIAFIFNKMDEIIDYYNYSNQKDNFERD